jgi:endonuclease YncB( thermonuclease family)
VVRQRRKRGFVSDGLIPLGAGLAVTSGILFGMSALFGTGSLPQPTTPAAAETTGSVLEGEPAETVAPADRDVTPAGVTPGPKVVGPLIRVKRPVTEITLESRGAESLYRKVVVLDAGTFRAVVDNTPVMVRLDGLAAPAFNDACLDDGGHEWKCGARARAELARLILNRSVSCVITENSKPAEPVGRCRVGQFDLGEWMVERGWADPADGAAQRLIDLGAEAKANRRGRYGSAPQGVIAG